MTPTTAQAIQRLRDAFPREEFPDRTVALYGQELMNLPPETVARAVEILVRRNRFLPRLSEILTEVAEIELGLPTVEEAWDIVLRGNLKNAPPEVQAASKACGGRETIMHSDNATTIRAQFMRDYAARRENTVRVFIGARVPPVLPGPPMLGPTMASLPETTRIRPRPIMSRLHHRWAGHRLEAPTEAEIRDAIEILREGPQTDDPAEDPLYAEAERIMAEADGG